MLTKFFKRSQEANPLHRGARLGVTWVVPLALVAYILSAVDLSGGFEGPVGLYHQGEFLASYWHMLAFYRGNAPFPIFIHGGMDYLPSLLAGALSDGRHIIYGTRLLIVVITLLCWCLFLRLGLEVLRNRHAHASEILLFCFYFALSLRLSDLEIVSLEEAPVGIRDIFVLSQIALLYSYFSTDRRRLWKLFAAFLFLPPAIFWSYDRGIGATIASLTTILYMLVKGRRLEALVSLAGAATAGAAIQVWQGAGTIQENVYNILYWVEASSLVWGTNWPGGVFGAIALMPLSVFVGALYCTFILGWGATPSLRPFFIFVVVLEVILLKSAYNRPSLHRGLMGIWPSTILLLIAIRSSEGLISRVIRPVRLLALATLLLALIIYSGPIQFRFAPGSVFGHRLYERAARTDREISGEVLTIISDMLSRDSCSLNFVNQGVLTLLSGGVHCTRFPYLIYATPNAEEAIIRDLRDSSVAHVVVDSGDWTVAIDGRSMSSRLPRLHEYLINTYPVRTSIGTYTVLSR